MLTREYGPECRPALTDRIPALIHIHDKEPAPTARSRYRKGDDHHAECRSTVCMADAPFRFGSRAGQCIERAAETVVCISAAGAGTASKVIVPVTSVSPSSSGATNSIDPRILPLLELVIVISPSVA
jgi:hypothetical protein